MQRFTIWAVLLLACTSSSQSNDGDGPVGRNTPTIPEPMPTTAPTTSSAPPDQIPDPTMSRAARLVTDGRAAFRSDTLGSEAWFGTKLRLHEAIAAMSPNELHTYGLAIDSAALPAAFVELIRQGKVNMNDPAITKQLLQSDAVVGLKGVFDRTGLVSMGITCALCHSRVDDPIGPGFGVRRDGWPNRDLDPGKILTSTPGPKGRWNGVPIPSLFGLSGVSQATTRGSGSVAWAIANDAMNTMHGSGRFRDASGKIADVGVDRVSSKLPAIEAYLVALPAPPLPPGTFDPRASERGHATFDAHCASCHIPPLFSEPGNAMHDAQEIGIEGGGSFRTTPLTGVFTRLGQGGFYHDGRFSDLGAVIGHYEQTFGFVLDDRESADLIEYLKSL